MSDQTANPVQGPGGRRAESPPSPRRAFEGYEPKLEGFESLVEALRIALDFRGDVTITTHAGRTLTCYLFNCEPDRPEPYFEFFERGQDEKGRLGYHEVAAIRFSAVDPAAGRSWENWVEKHRQKKQAQAEGRDIGDIEPKLMPLDD